MPSKFNSVLQSLKPFLEKENFYNKHGKKIGNAQRKQRRNTLIQAFKTLRCSNFRLNDATLFKERHFILLFKMWLDQGLSASTIQYRSSVLRIFSNNWLKKAGMIKSTVYYSQQNPNRVKRIVAAVESKCWSDNNVAPEEKIREISLYDERVAIQLELQLIFSLRKKESFLLKPYIADCEGLLLVKWGTKGGKPRIISIDSDTKRELIQRAKTMTQKQNDSMIPSNKTLKNWSAHYKYVLNKFDINKKELGVTSHGLRHEGANRLYEQVTGLKSSIQGGNISYDKKDIDDLARDKVSHDLGHVRRSISSAYTGVQKLFKPESSSIS